MTKEEKKKLKREEEQRKIEEEAMAKQRELEEVRMAKQRQSAEKAEKFKKENEERRTRRLEMLEMGELMAAHEKALNNYLHEERRLAAWNRYMRCDGTPNPASVPEMNTYIHVRAESRERDSAVDILDDTEIDLGLVEELHDHIGDNAFKNPGHTDLLNAILKDLQNLVMAKLDMGTFRILCDASELTNYEPVNLSHVIKSSNVCLCVWGNMSKNPRIKQHEFKELDISFDIPRNLAIVPCAIRVLYTSFDFVSPTSPAFYLYPLEKMANQLLEDQEFSEDAADTLSTGGGEVGSVKGAEGGVKGTDVSSTTKEVHSLGLADYGEPAEDKEEQQQQVEEVEQDYEYPPTPELVEYEDRFYEEDVVDLRSHQSLGGVYKIDALALPPQPKIVNEWTLTTLVDPPHLEYMEYSSTSAPSRSSSARHDRSLLGHEDSLSMVVSSVEDTSDPSTSPKDERTSSKFEKKKKAEERPPIAVTVTIPPHVCFLEDPIVAKWNEKEKLWRLDDIVPQLPEHYNREKRTLKFFMHTFGTVALFQDIHSNMPFESWELRPHSPNSGVLTIIAAISEVEIEIKDNLCCLSQPLDAPELDSIRSKWVPPHILVHMMRRVGLNLFPLADTNRYVSALEKQPEVEKMVYRYMAMTSGAMAYSWSKWNAEAEEPDVFVMQAAEAVDEQILMQAELKKQEDPEEWFSVLMTKTTCKKLLLTEFDTKFRKEKASILGFHSNLYHMIRVSASKRTVERMSQSTPVYINCVEKLLNYTRLLTFS